MITSPPASPASGNGSITSSVAELLSVEIVFPLILISPRSNVVELVPMLIVVAAPAKFIVVATVLYKFWVVWVPTTVGLPIVAVPEFAPIFNVAAAPAKFIVVAVELYKFWVACVPTNVGLLIVAVPEVAPISIAVAEPNAFTVVAFVSNKLNVVALVVISPPSTFKSRSMSTLAVLNVVNSEPFVVVNAR